MNATQLHSNTFLDKVLSALLQEILVKLALLLIRVVATPAIPRALVDRLHASCFEVVNLA